MNSGLDPSSEDEKIAGVKNYRVLPFGLCAGQFSNSLSKHIGKPKRGYACFFRVIRSAQTLSLFFSKASMLKMLCRLHTSGVEDPVARRATRVL